jgi:hypothetical protein
VNVNLTLGGISTLLSPEFWGTTLSPRAPMFPNEAALLNATPTQVIVWPGGSTGDAYNPLNNTITHTSGKNASWKTPATSEAEFVNWCKSIRCTAIFQVPVEINNISIADQVVNYTEKTLGFHPAYWELGNEPEYWKEWNIPWTKWGAERNSNKNVITPTQYGSLAHNFTVALKAIDPTIKIIGLAAAGRPHNKIPVSAWINATVAADGSLISGIAMHVYSNGRLGPYTPQNFYGGIEGNWSVLRDVTGAQKDVSNQLNTTCPTCASIPIFVTEIGSAVSFQGYGGFARQFPGALGTAAMELQGITLGLPSEDIFAGIMGTANSWMNFKEQFRPDYTMYSQMLSHIGNEVYPVSFQTPSGPAYNGGNDSLSANLQGVASQDPAHSSRSDLFLLNLNLTTNVSLVPYLPGVPRSAPTELWTWSGKVMYSSTNKSTWVVPATYMPVPTFFPNGLPANWTLPAQTAALFEAYPGSAGPAVFQESGLPSGTRWFLSVSGSQYESTNLNITELLPVGTYPLYAAPLVQPFNRTLKNPKERYEPFPPPSVTVSMTLQTVPIPYDLQWALNLTESPKGFGAILPFEKWANASAPLTLQEKPAPGKIFTRWSGWGAGSLNATNTSITITPRGALRETANFVQGYTMSFTEEGLPSGTNWSVMIRGYTNASQGSMVSFLERNGTYRYDVGGVNGYMATPKSSSLNITGQPVQVTVVFSPIPRAYQLTFVEWWLPSGTNWTVALNGVLHYSTTASIAVTVANGTYFYSVGSVAGYTEAPNSGTVVVNGTSPSISIIFTAVPRGQYVVAFSESGLRLGTNWSVTLGGATLNSTGGTITFTEPNATFSYTVGTVTGYTASPPSGDVTVSGSAISVSIAFGLSPQYAYAITFMESGLPSGTSWSIILSGSPASATAYTITYFEPNGTYSFMILTVAGYSSSPFLGNVVVSGATVFVSVMFTPSGGSGSSGIRILGLSTMDSYLALMGVAISAVAIAAVLLIQRRKDEEAMQSQEPGHGKGPRGQAPGRPPAYPPRY